MDNHAVGPAGRARPRGAGGAGSTGRCQQVAGRLPGRRRVGTADPRAEEIRDGHRERERRGTPGLQGLLSRAGTPRPAGTPGSAGTPGPSETPGPAGIPRLAGTSSFVEAPGPFRDPRPCRDPPCALTQTYGHRKHFPAQVFYSSI